ncbi:MAG TPA: hypothetical protein V6C57_24240 [Coleofasciculaceae cyanobacterium]
MGYLNVVLGYLNVVLGLLNALLKFSDIVLENLNAGLQLLILVLRLPNLPKILSLTGNAL